MFDAYDNWRRLMASGMTMSQTSLRTIEMLNAASDVVATRIGLIEAAMRSPLTANHVELGRMVPEKVDAFSRASSVTVTAWWAAQSAWIAQMQYFATLAMRGRPLSASECGNVASHTGAVMLQSIEAAARLGSQTLAPVHRKATANARRLKRTAKKPQ